MGVVSRGPRTKENEKVTMNIIPKLKRESSFESTSSSSTDDAEEGESIPLALKAEFLTAVMSKDYAEALKLCDIMLRFDAEDNLAKDYRPVLAAYLEQESEEESESESEESESESESDDEVDEEDEAIDQLADSIEQMRVNSAKART